MDKLISLKDKNIIKVLTGIRRCGKSTILNQFKNHLIENGIKNENISINFEDNNNNNLLDGEILHKYIMEHTDSNTKNYIFLDELQNVIGFEKCIDSLLLREYLDIYNWFKLIYVI